MQTIYTQNVNFPEKLKLQGIAFNINPNPKPIYFEKQSPFDP